MTAPKKRRWTKKQEWGVAYWVSDDGYTIRWGFAGLYNGEYEQDGTRKVHGRQDHGYCVVHPERGRMGKGYSSFTKAKKSLER